MSKVRTLSKEIKKERLTGFLNSLHTHIQRKSNFSFTSKASKYKLTWSSNAMAIKRIMIELEIIERVGIQGYQYTYTEKGEKLTTEEIIELILKETDHDDKNYLERFDTDIIPGTLGEPITEEEEKKIEQLKKPVRIITSESSSNGRHRFGHRDIPEGQATVIETCEICGLASKRYAGNVRAYFIDNHRTQVKAPPCTPIEIKNIPEEKGIVVNIVKPVEVPLNVIKEIHKPLPVKSALTETEARLRDALVIIKLLYEDLVKNNVNSTARNMAGRYLYCSEHQELIKNLDSKTG
jgi:hypothetical protein